MDDMKHGYIHDAEKQFSGALQYINTVKNHFKKYTEIIHDSCNCFNLLVTQSLEQCNKKGPMYHIPLWDTLLCWSRWESSSKSMKILSMVSNRSCQIQVAPQDWIKLMKLMYLVVKWNHKSGLLKRTSYLAVSLMNTLKL